MLDSKRWGNIPWRLEQEVMHLLVDGKYEDYHKLKQKGTRNA